MLKKVLRGRPFDSWCGLYFFDEKDCAANNGKKIVCSATYGEKNGKNVKCKFLLFKNNICRYFNFKFKF